MRLTRNERIAALPGQEAGRAEIPPHVAKATRAALAKIAVWPGDPSALVDEHQVAARLKLSVRTVRGWRARGQHLPVVRLGRAVRYVVGDVEAWLGAQRTEAVFGGRS